MKYIENMFNSNIINGLIEGLNNKIKSIKRTAFGYSNFSNFKKRILIEAGIISISAQFFNSIKQFNYTKKENLFKIFIPKKILLIMLIVSLNFFINTI